MSLIRGMRSLSYGYARDFIPVPETEENILPYIMLESKDEEAECCVTLTNVSPEFISLNARMIPIKISSTATAERFENGTSLGENNLYSSPVIYHNSVLKNPKSFCSKIVLKFENSGEYFMNQKKTCFFNKTFDDYDLKFENDDTHLFEKDFFISNGATIEKVTKQIGKETTLDGSSEIAPHRIYPYAGFYEYGAHPQEIESCIFQINSGEVSSAIKISKLSSFKKIGVNPTENSILKDGIKFIGITNFSKSQKVSLYDELLDGACKISITNRNTQEICEYKSNSLTHIANTDLITINFMKG